MNLDAMQEKLSHAVVVLDAGIYAEGLSVNQLRTLMHVALNLIEDARCGGEDLQADDHAEQSQETHS